MRIYKMLFMALLLAVFIAGCNNDNNNGGGGSADTTAPTVSSTNPIDTTPNVATNRKITAIFSEPMATASCTATTFTLHDDTAATDVTGTVTCVGRTATFTPTSPSPLVASHLYTATITTGMKDKAGNALAVNKVWTFTTGATTDTTAPTVSSTDPADTATGVAINGNIAATFNEAIDPATITTATFTLKKGATPVSGTVTSADAVATFNPTSNLVPSTLYTATITTGAADLAGNALAVNKVWTFTTGTATAAGPAPVLLGTAGNFAILTKAGITDVPSSAITGNVGTSPITGASITGLSCTEVTGTIYDVDAAYTGGFNSNTACLVTDATLLTTAVSDMELAYTDAAGRTTPAPVTELGAGNIDGLVLPPGLYKWSSGVVIPIGVTLAGGANDVWIFQIAGDLTVANAAIVHLSGGAQAKNIFWQTFGVANIGTTAQFEGTILSQTSISMGTGAVMNGRALAQTAVTLETNTVTKP